MLWVLSLDTLIYSSHKLSALARMTHYSGGPCFSWHQTLINNYLSAMRCLCLPMSSVLMESKCLSVPCSWCPKLTNCSLWSQTRWIRDRYWTAQRTYRCVDLDCKTILRVTNQAKLKVWSETCSYENPCYQIIMPQIPWLIKLTLQVPPSISNIHFQLYSVL